MYLPKTWAGDDTNHKNTLDTTKQNMHRACQRQRDQTYRNGQVFDPDADVKVPAEIAQENADREAIRVALRQLTFTFAQNEFYQYKTVQSGNPWDDGLKNVMFWM